MLVQLSSNRSALLQLFFFNDTASTEFYTLSLHDALPISASCRGLTARHFSPAARRRRSSSPPSARAATPRSSTRSRASGAIRDRKSTRLNSSHSQISYAVFCLKKKRQKSHHKRRKPPHR